MKKKIFTLMLAIALALSLAGCAQRQSDRVSYNLALEADNFNCYRQLTVINCIQGDVLFQMSGVFSIKADTADNQLEVTVETNSLGENKTYSKHFIGLSDNVTYVVEDLGSVGVDRYQYTLNFNPKMWVPVQADVID